MAAFTSTTYPALTLQDEGGVWAQFVGGRFETDNAAVAARLRALPESEGIVEDEPPARPAAKRQTRTAAK